MARVSKQGAVSLAAEEAGVRPQGFINFAAKKFVDEFKYDLLTMPRPVRRSVEVMDRPGYVVWYISGPTQCLVLTANKHPTGPKNTHTIMVQEEVRLRTTILQPTFHVRGWGAALIVATDIAHQLQQIPVDELGRIPYPRYGVDAVLDAMAWAYMNFGQWVVMDMERRRHPRYAGPTRWEHEVELNERSYRRRSKYPKILDMVAIGKEMLKMGESGEDT